MYHAVVPYCFWQLRLGRSLNSGIERACFQESFRAALPGCTGCPFDDAEKKDAAELQGCCGLGGGVGGKISSTKGGAFNVN